MPPGVYFTPLKKVTEVSGKELPVVLNDLKPRTSDKIYLEDLDLDIYVTIDKSKAVEIMMKWPGDMTQEKGDDGVRVGFNYVNRMARGAVYDVVAELGSAEIHTKRSVIEARTQKALQASLDEVGKGWFVFNSVNVRNLKTDNALEEAIKLAANRQFQINAKEKEIELARKEADRKRIEAQGDADAIRVRAAAVQAQGGKEYVELEAIKKWDGKLPSTMPGNATPFVHVK